MIFVSLALATLAKPKVETLFFATVDCPISQRYTPEIKRIMRAYRETMRFRFVYEDTGVSKDAIDKYQADYNIKCQFVLDSDRALAKKYHVTTVPTALVKSDAGEILYFGRIDDAYGSDFRWHPAKNQDLRNALNALKEGKEVPVKRTPVIGCTLSY